MNQPEPIDQEPESVGVEITPTGNELVVFNEPKTELIFSGGKIDPLIDELERRLKSEAYDISTEEGRQRIGSVARKIGTTKQTLVRMANELTEDWREKTKKVNAERDAMIVRFDTLRDEIKKPLDDFKEREKTRVQGHETALQEMLNLAFFEHDPTSAEVRAVIEKIEATNREWEEFTQRAKDTKESVLAKLKILLETRTKFEADQAELERLRREEEERKAEAERQRIANEAAEKARKEAEEKAEEIRKAREAEIEAERVNHQIELAWADAHAENAEIDRLNAIRREQEAQERAELAAFEAMHNEACAENRAFDERIAAAKREQEAAERAAQQERERAAAVKAKEEEEEKQRAANPEHRRDINREILSALRIKCDISGESDDFFKIIIEAIAKGEIPHVKINY